MKVLGIGYGRHLFDQDNFEYKRLQSCAGAVDSFDHIVFTHKKDTLKKVVVGNFTIHPTNSSSKLSMLFDAIMIGIQVIQDKQITVISTQDVFETGFVGLQLKKKFPALALQVQEHGDVLSSKYWKKEKLSNRLRLWFAFRVLRRADIVRVVSKRTKDFLHKKLGQDKKIHTFPVVIDLQQFTIPNKQQKLSTDTFTYVTAARFVPQKNFPLMLRAFASAYKENNKLRLRIFGEGVLEKDIKKLINILDITSVVELRSWTSNLGIEMLEADAYLLTSNYEGWARVLIEAMVLGLPVVTTDVGCVGEVLQDQKHGLVVPVGDEGLLAEAIKTLSIDADLYNKIKNILSNTTLDTIAGTSVETYPQDWALTLQ